MTFFPSSLSGIALSPPIIAIADQMGNLLFLSDAVPHAIAMQVESGLDHPQLAAYGSQLISIGRWDSQIQAWDSKQHTPIWTHELGKGFSRCLISDRTQAIFAFSATDPHSQSFKDQIPLLPSVLLQVDPTGQIQELNWPNKQQGQVDLLAMNQTHILIHLKEQATALELFTIFTGHSTVVPLEHQIHALHTTQDGRFLAASDNGIWDIHSDSSPTLLFPLDEDFPMVLQFVSNSKQDIYAMTSEGVFFLSSSSPQRLGTSEQAVTIKMYEDELFVLWNGGEIERWDTSNLQRKKSIPLSALSQN